MSGATGSGPLVATFNGFVQNSMDGLVLFEACLSGKLHHVPRRPHDRERTSLIKSGSIFIYEENASGIKRWTDGVAWSPSRILGNFLIYRELEKPFPPGEKKRAMKRKRSTQLDGVPGRETDEQDGADTSIPPSSPSPKPLPIPEQSTDPATNDSERELDRQLIGSLVDSYGFRPDGLVKKTMSIAINGISHHLVSYYKVEDVKHRVLKRPQEDPRLANLTIRPELYLKQNFRTPVEETEHYVVDPTNMHAHPGVSYGGPMMPGAYAMRPGHYMPPGYPMYGGSPGGMYAAPPPASGWPQPPQSSLPAYQGQSYSQPSYNDYYNRTSAGTPQSALVKTEDPGHGAPPYNHYGSSGVYGQRPGSGSFPSMHAGQYQSPMRPPSTSYSATGPAQHSSATPVSTSSAHSYIPPTTATQGYDGKPQNTTYATQSAPSHYPTHGAHPAQPADQLKSPNSGAGQTTASGPHSGVPYRQSPYSTQEGAPHNDMGNMAMQPAYAGSHVQAAPYHGAPYGTYSTSAQGYRPAVDGQAASNNNQSQF